MFAESGLLKSPRTWLTALFILCLPLAVYWVIDEPLTDEVFDRYVSRGVYLSDIALIGMIAYVFIAQPFRHPGWSWVSWPILGLGLLGLVSAWGASAPSLALYTAVRWIVAWLVLVWFAHGPLPTATLTKFLLLVLAAHVFIGLGQVIFQQPLGVPAELALSPDLSGASVILTDGLRWLRAYGLTYHPNVLGGFMVVGILLGLPLIGSRSGRIIWWLLWLGLFISFSRSAWIAAAVMVPVLFLLGFKQGWLAGKTPALALAGAAIILIICALVWRSQLEVRLSPLLARLSSEPTIAGDFAFTEGISVVERGDLN